MEFEVKTLINASPKAIYDSWLDSQSHSEMTGGEADVSDQVGGRFTAWDGYIEGTNVLLEENQRIIQKWRTSEFSEEEEDSIIEISFAAKGEQTELCLKHSQLPAHGEQYLSGWENHYFTPMKAYFS